MNQQFIHQTNQSKLLLFFAGWGSDEHLFSYPAPEGYDYMLCFDYTTMDFDFSRLVPYQSIRLMGWSMGVWVASIIFSGKEMPWEKKTAINGTLFPKHDSLGIPKHIFEGTLNSFSPTTLAKFRRRMCGSSQGVKEFLSHQPYRSLESLYTELEALNNRLDTYHACPDFHWDQAIIGTHDLIFPTQNQRNAWKETTNIQHSTQITEMDAAHYDISLFGMCMNE